MKYEAILLLVLFSLTFVYAECGADQVDINTASLEDLDLLTGIGPAYAQRIVDGRSFDSVDDLTSVSGIGSVTLQNIKDQGLACVSGEESSQNEDDGEEVVNNETDDDPDEEYDSPEEDDAEPNTYVRTSGTVIMELNDTPKTVINLKSSKTVEQENDVAYESKNEKIKSYSIYAFLGFLVLVIGYLLFS
jgi:competence ComEA-like helix-hairpin-helix protein